MVAVSSHGAWARATEVRLPANADVNPLAQVGSIDCTSVGNCVAAGYYNSDFRLQGFAATESGGRWQQAVLLTPPDSTPAGTYFRINGVDCTAPGFCVAVGNYEDHLGRIQAMAVVESHGRWARAIKLRMPANAGSNPGAFILTVSCLQTGTCVIGGDYLDSSGNDHVLAVTESAGRWRQATELTLPRGAATSPKADLDSLTCTGVGSCVGVGTYKDRSGTFDSFALTESARRWQHAIKVYLLPANAGAHSPLLLSSVACTRAGSCLALGGYVTKSKGLAIATVVESAGRWTKARAVTPPPDANTSATVDVSARSISCTRAGYCAAVASYVDLTGEFQSMAAATPLP